MTFVRWSQVTRSQGRVGTGMADLTGGMEEGIMNPPKDEDLLSDPFS